MTSELKPDGTIHTTYPDGRSAVTKELADGKLVTEFSDKSVLAYDPKNAADGISRQGPWDIVKSWSGGQLSGFTESTGNTVQSHPWASMAGAAVSSGSEYYSQVGKTMADEAAGLAGNAAAEQIIANSMIDSGTPGAGRAAIEALEASAQAGSKAGSASLAGTGAKMLGWPATIGVNAYINIDDWRNHEKPGDEALANAIGGSVGGMAGAWLGVAASPICGPFAPLCAVGFAGLGGFALGSIGAYAAEESVKG